MTVDEFKSECNRSTVKDEDFKHAYRTFLRMAPLEQQTIVDVCATLRDLRNPTSGKPIRGIGWPTALVMCMEIGRYLDKRDCLQ